MFLETNQYEKFKLLTANRKVAPAHAMRLLRDIQMNGLLSPIIVDKNFNILDGQHRFAALKMIQRPICYIIREDLSHKNISSLNLQKKWETKDFVNKFSIEGNPDFKKIEDFAKELDVSIPVAARLLCGRGSIQQQIQRGVVKIRNQISHEEVECFLKTVNLLETLNGKKQFYKCYRFVTALFDLLRSSQFDEKKWMQNLTKLNNRVTPKVSYSDYLDMLEKIYNYNKVNKISVKGN